MNETLAWCLGCEPHGAKMETLRDWLPHWQELDADRLGPVSLALRGGFQSDRVAWAFLAGYQAAIRSMLARHTERTVAAGELLAFCATESGGNRPRHITTTIEGEGAALRVSGEKSWTTLGAAATTLLVVGRRPSPDDNARPRLAVACLPADAPGVTFVDRPPIPYVPEIPHTASRLANVAAAGGAALLPGDGYSDYVKPFRTIEDTFIALAMQAWLLREARVRGWPSAYREKLAVQLVALAELADADPTSPLTHVALAGALTETKKAYEWADQQWHGETDRAAERWQRDRPLFEVASKVRAARAERAWQALSEGMTAPSAS